MANRHGLGVLYRKELADHLNSMRFLILFFILAIVTVLSLNGAISTLASAAQSTDSSQSTATTTTFMFLQLFTTAGSNIYSFSTFLGLLGPIVGIMLGFDAINEEKAQGTLNRLAAQPIYRDTIINAKFLAGLTTIAIMILSLGGFVVGVGMIKTGLIPSSEEIARIVIYLVVAVIYIAIWLALAEFFSVVCKHAATAAIACVVVWLILVLFMGTLASAIAGSIYPSASQNSQLIIKSYQLQTNISRISPYYLFGEVQTMIMNPNIYSTNAVSLLMASQEGAVAGYLSLTQSVLQIWPHIVSMFAEVAACFAAAYITFMKQEIRA